MGAFNDISGKKYGILVAVRRAKNANKETMWECLCDCGNTYVTRASNLVGGIKKSCGCLTSILKGRSKTHGMSNTKIYHAWESMLGRCRNHNNPSWCDYGGRGITVCDRWLSFENFMEDMGVPNPKDTIDRIDVNGNYEKSNCRWTTPTVQMRNTRLTKKCGVGVTRIGNKKDRFRVKITVEDTSVHVGVFNNELDAMFARKVAELKYWGEN